MSAGRRAFVYPLVLGAVLMLAILILGLSTLVTGDIRQTRFVIDDTTHLYVADALFARELNRLKGAPWARRWYARPGDAAPSGAVERSGSYRGAETFVAVQDVRGPGGAPVPGLVDVFARVTQNGTAMSYVCRVELRAATALRPTAVRVRRWARTSARVDSVDGREQALARLAGDEEARQQNLPETAVIVREASQRLGGYDPNTEEVVRELRRSFSGEAGLERAWLEKLRRGDAELAATPPRAEAAAETYDEALRAANSQSGPHRDANVPRSLERLAAARALLAEGRPLYRPERASKLAEAHKSLEEIVSKYPDSPEAPRALLRRAWLSLKEGGPGRATEWGRCRARAEALLTELGTRYAAHHLWDEDRTVKELLAPLKARLQRTVTWTQGGRIVAASVTGAKPLRPGPAAPLLPGLSPQARAHWSPDGSALSFDAEVAPGRSAVFTCDATGLELRRWTPDAWGDCRTASYSPDGARLAFTRAAAGKSQVVSLAADGSGERAHSPEGELASDPVWTRDGALMYASAGAIWFVHADGSSSPTRITTAEAGVLHARPAPAPVRKLVLFRRAPPEQPGHLYAVSEDAEEAGAEPVTSGTHDYTSCSWFHLEEPTVIAARRSAGNSALVILDTEDQDKEPELFLDAPGALVDDPAFSPIPDSAGTGEPEP